MEEINVSNTNLEESGTPIKQISSLISAKHTSTDSSVDHFFVLSLSHAVNGLIEKALLKVLNIFSSSPLSSKLS
ncbi:Uncharacterized protein FKW44_000146 [Caligus rogercresseyi]|uniref:Uncharacterized protein n=1 Tax=Caligus rogercresseyi TaxID=217165 RepID=A0A7T8QUP1_CALRO|nr:Uncharacterized protein FKW44_000146 [Caligus rogercresseyi]